MFPLKLRAPTRVDLAGGTLDLWPIHQILKQKATVNVGIELWANVEVDKSPSGVYHLESTDQQTSVQGHWSEIANADHKLGLIGLIVNHIWRSDLPPLRITTNASIPAGSGLGGSSCLAIAVACALDLAKSRVEKHQPLSEQELVSCVQDIEARLIHAPTGCQDYWGGVRGRVNAISYPPGKIQVESLHPDSISGLDESMLVVYSGQSRASAINNWQIFKKIFDRDEQVISTFEGIGYHAQQCVEALRAKSLERLLFHSKAEWDLRVKLWPNIETPATRVVSEVAAKSGAIFSRVCGAGGGGAMAVFCEPDTKSKVESAMESAGIQILRTRISRTGVEVLQG